MYDKLVEVLIARIPRGLRSRLDCLLRNHYVKTGHYVIPAFNGFVFDRNNLKYEFCCHLNTLDCVVNEYRYSDILKTDVVVDLGANIGAFSMPAALLADRVYAVEPLYTDILKRNILANHLDNVYVLEVGISDKVEDVVLRYGERKKTACCVPLSDVFDQTGGCDFLKTDCEGGELSITVEDLNRVRRRVEGEIHFFIGGNKKRIEQDFFEKFDDACFNVVVDYRSETTKLFHAYRRDA